MDRDLLDGFNDFEDDDNEKIIDMDEIALLIRGIYQSMMRVGFSREEALIIALDMYSDYLGMLGD